SWIAALSRSILIRSGARRRGEALDEVSAAIPGDAVAGNEKISRSVSDRLYCPCLGFIFWESTSPC
ncbi:MAG: hypothetical protein WA133_03170, partial [Syntrophales bacterium]